MITLGVSFIVSILHESVVFQNWSPISLIFHLFAARIGVRWHKLFHRNRVSVEILQSHIGEERNIGLIGESDFDTCLGWFGCSSDLVANLTSDILDCKLSSRSTFHLLNFFN